MRGFCQRILERGDLEAKLAQPAPDLDDGEQLLWRGIPSPTRMMIPSIGSFGFGVVWTAFIVNFIYMWHNNGPKNAQGPVGIFGMEGILSNIFCT